MIKALTKTPPGGELRKRWFTSLLFKCLAGILGVSCLGIFVVLFSLGIKEKSRLKQELLPESLLLSVQNGLKGNGAALLPDSDDSPSCDSLLTSLIPEILSKKNVFWRRYSRSLAMKEENPLLVRYRLPDGTFCQVPGNRRDGLYDAVVEKENEASRSRPAVLWNEGVSDAWQSVVSIVPERQPKTVLTVGVQMDNRLTHMIFPELKPLGWTLVFLFVTSLLSAILIVAFLVYRIRKAERAAATWARGDLSVRIGDTHRDEFANLTDTFDQMADAMGKLIEVRQSLAAAEERNRLARDLHDTVKQRCFALGLQLSILSHQCKNDADKESQVQAALDLTALMQKDLSDVIYRFSGPTIAGSGLKQAIVDALDLFLHGSLLKWSLEVDDEDFRILEADQALSAQLLLITNEAVANALKHSEASQLVISFQKENGRGIWMIYDNGKGFDTSKALGKGIGLTNLLQRARTLSGGRLQIDSGSGEGTILIISFDMKEQDQA